MAQSRLREAEKVESVLVETIKPDPPIKFVFKGTPTKHSILIKFDSVSFGYDRMIFDTITLNVEKSSRIAIVGPNGTGKSTLLKLMNGELKPNSGIVSIADGIEIGYFSQYHADQLDYRLTPLQLFRQSEFPEKYTLQQMRRILASFGIKGESAVTPIMALSSGMKTKFILAIFAAKRPHVLLLDEVTNNLDMDSIVALAESLRRFPGAIVMVSHNSTFVDSIGCSLLECNGNGIRSIDCRFEEYKKTIRSNILM